MNKLVFAAISTIMTFSTFATPYVTNVVAKQRYPWNGYVDVNYEIVGSTNGIKNVYGVLKATDKGTGKVYSASTFVRPLDLSEGEHHSIWNMPADVELVSTNIIFSMSIERQALYLVVDLSAGKDAANYPVSELLDVPDGGWSEEYKTTKLVLRYIKPGLFTMREKYEVVHTVPYFIGVFEVTQKQYELVIGSNPNESKGYNQNDMKPVTYLTWSKIRGESNVHNWPTVRTVDLNSFIGKLQKRTGLKFDLPTEMQWEYAERAGRSALPWGNYNDSSIIEQWYNECAVVRDYGGSIAVVGTKKPNAWGLYDMIGNVEEWCLDWYGDLCSGVDYVGPVSGEDRVVRGGDFWDYLNYSDDVMYRMKDGPYNTGVLSCKGFRVAIRTLVEE